MTNRQTTFDTTAYWASFHKPRALPNGIPSKNYGCSILVEDIPPSLSAYAEPKPASERLIAFDPSYEGVVFHSIRQPFKPTISTDDYQAVQRLMEAAKIANVSLFHDLPVTVCMDMHEVGPRPDRPRLNRYELLLLAVQFTAFDLEETFERSINRYFGG